MKYRVEITFQGKKEVGQVIEVATGRIVAKKESPFSFQGSSFEEMTDLRMKVFN